MAILLIRRCLQDQDLRNRDAESWGVISYDVSVVCNVLRWQNLQRESNLTELNPNHVSLSRDSFSQEVEADFIRVLGHKILKNNASSQQAPALTKVGHNLSTIFLI